MCHHYSRLPPRGGRCYHSCQMTDCKVPHLSPSSIHLLCSRCPLQPSEPYSSPSTLHFVLWDGKRYPPGSSHYADSIWLLHASDCAMHLHCAHSHSYSNANIISSNCGPFGIIHPCQADANED